MKTRPLQWGLPIDSLDVSTSCAGPTRVSCAPRQHSGLDRQAARFPIGLTAIRSPAASSTEVRLRSSGLPDLDSILYVASRVSFALRAISATPPRARAT